VSRLEIDRALLSAYVDGELDVARAADVMAAAARDPALARELSALARLKASLGESIEVPVLDIDLARPAPRRRVAIAAYAACAACVAGLILALSFVLFGGGPSNDLAWARAAHKSWTGATGTAAATAAAAPAAGARSAVVPGAYMPGAYVPDLAAAKLSIAYVGQARVQGSRRAMVVGYRGTRGCKVSLIVTRSAGRFTRTLETLEIAPHRGFAWRAGDLDYLVIAEGMAAPRLALIARSVRETSLHRLPLDQATRTALAKSRATSAPCRA
jgi:anti-sigma factor RsiW